MADEALKILLCLPGKHRNYAVELPYAEETCRDVMISLIPCLPGHPAGACNYKGSIVSVVCQEGSAPSGEEAEVRQTVLVLRHQRYSLGILLHQELYPTQIDADEQIKGLKQQGSGLWVEKAYFMWSGSLYSLIDVEKTLEELVISEQNANRSWEISDFLQLRSFFIADRY